MLFGADTENIAKKIADGLRAAFVELDSENKIYRIVLGENYADIAQGLNNNVDDDIQRRDFTINSIFYDLKNSDFVDIAGGFKDIKQRVIKTADLKNLNDDPLRMLRAFRFKAQLGFEIDSEVLEYIKNNGKKLNTVAKERIKSRNNKDV